MKGPRIVRPVVNRYRRSPAVARAGSAFRPPQTRDAPSVRVPTYGPALRVTFWIRASGPDFLPVMSSDRNGKVTFGTVVDEDGRSQKIAADERDKFAVE